MRFLEKILSIHHYIPGNRKNSFTVCLFVTFIIGLLAHSMGMFNGYLSHDSLRQLFMTDKSWHISLGRFLVPYYKQLMRSHFTLPLLEVLLTLLYYSLSTWIIAKIFNFKSMLSTALIASIFTVNISCILYLVTYRFTADCVALNTFLFLLVTYFIIQGKHILLSCLLMASGVAMGGQANCFIMPTVLIAYTIQQLLLGIPAKTVNAYIRRFLFVVFIAVVLYAFGVWLFLKINNLKPLQTGYYSISTTLKYFYDNIFQLVPKAYFGPIIFFTNKTVYNIPIIKMLFLLSFLTIGFLCLYFIKINKISLSRTILCACCFVILPLAANAVCFISQRGTNSHMLLPYFLPLLLLPALWESLLKMNVIVTRALLTLFVCILFLVFTFHGIRFANILYAKKDLEQKATASIITRILGRIESIPEYKPGITPVYLYSGSIQKSSHNIDFLNPLPQYKGYYSLTGQTRPCDITYRSVVRVYFNSVLNANMRFATVAPTDFDALDEALKDVFAYPDKHCYKNIDGTIYFKVK